jgi:hypothetical protein
MTPCHRFMAYGYVSLRCDFDTLPGRTEVSRRELFQKSQPCLPRGDYINNDDTAASRWPTPCQTAATTRLRGHNGTRLSLCCPLILPPRVAGHCPICSSRYLLALNSMLCAARDTEKFKSISRFSMIRGGIMLNFEATAPSTPATASERLRISATPSNSAHVLLALQRPVRPEINAAQSGRRASRGDERRGRGRCGGRAPRAQA